MKLIKSKADHTQCASKYQFKKEWLPCNNASAGITYTQPVEQKVRKCSVSLGFNSWKEISNLRIPKDDMQVILGKYPNTPISNKSLIISNNIKQSMC